MRDLWGQRIFLRSITYLSLNMLGSRVAGIFKFWVRLRQDYNLFFTKFGIEELLKTKGSVKLRAMP